MRKYQTWHGSLVRFYSVTSLLWLVPVNISLLCTAVSLTSSSEVLLQEVCCIVFKKLIGYTPAETHYCNKLKDV